MNYPYKAMIDFLLGTNTDMINSQGQAVLNRAILNGVAINVKLFQAGNDFRLM